MAKKPENEQVVNRFLLSTVYAIIAAMGLYYLNALATYQNVLLAWNIFGFMFWGGIVGFVAFIAVRLILRKKLTWYYPVMFAVIALSGLFLRLNGQFPASINNMSHRIMIIGVVLALLYIYELIVYFLRVNKVDNNKKQ
ncbi:MAG: hypothetical protein IJE10_01595 [Clostridia bacterium]|nr:hypothetical protein [Clostridia bacterium]